MHSRPASAIRVAFLAILTVSLPHCATTNKTKKLEAKKATRADDPTIAKPELRPAGGHFTTLSSYKILRRVGMHYKLDLQEDNAYAPATAQTMRLHEDKVRACYLSRLDDVPNLKGQVALSFVLSKDSGGMEKVEQTGGTLKDKPLLACLTRELSAIPFYIPKEMKGRLLYDFAAEETVAKAP